MRIATLTLAVTLAAGLAPTTDSRSVAAPAGDRQIATAALIRRSDLGSGWRQATPLASRRTGAPACFAKRPPASAVAKRGFVAPHRWLLGEALVFRSAPAAGRFLTHDRSLRFQACVMSALTKQYHSTNGSGSLTFHAIPTAFGWYVATDKAPTVYIHYVFARHARVVVWFAQGAVAVPFARKDAALLRLMLSRAR